MMYRGIMEQVSCQLSYFPSFREERLLPNSCIILKHIFQGYQDAFPVVPLGCSESQVALQDFITTAKAALVAIGIVRDPVMCKFYLTSFLFRANLFYNG
jgi:hypothetical protein